MKNRGFSIQSSKSLTKWEEKELQSFLGSGISAKCTGILIPFWGLQTVAEVFSNYPVNTLEHDNKLVSWRETLIVGFLAISK